MLDYTFIQEQVARIGAGKAVHPSQLQLELFSNNSTRKDQQLSSRIARELISSHSLFAPKNKDKCIYICLQAWDKFSSSLSKKEQLTGRHRILQALLEISASQNELWRRSWLEIALDISVSAKQLLPPTRSVTQELLLKGELYLAWQQSQLEGQDRQVGTLAYTLMLDSLNLVAEIRSKNSAGHLSQQDKVQGLIVLVARGDSSVKTDRHLLRRFKQTELGHLAHGLISSESIDLSQSWAILGDIEEESRIENQLLGLAALARLQRQNRKFDLAKITEKLYLSVFTSVAPTMIIDPWGLLKVQADPSYVDEQQTHMLKQVPPTASLQRMRESFSLSWRVSGILGPRRMAKLLGGSLHLHQLSEVEVSKISEELTQHFARLKGPVMKLGQTASYFAAGLPFTFSDPLKKLQSSATPLPWNRIEDTLIRTWGPKWCHHFSNFDFHPIGVGSISQVHKARLASGEDVVLKIRIPEIGSIIRSDFILMRGLVHLLLPLMRKPTYVVHRALQFLNELEQQISLECDFVREAQAMLRARKRFEHDGEIFIPKVYDRLSNEEILVQEYAPGLSLQEALNTDDIEMRDLWGRAIVRFVVTSCREADFNSDPHPGNFVFVDNGVYCLDFGSAIQWDEESKRSWNQLILACVEKNFDHYKTAMKAPVNLGKEHEAALYKHYQSLVFEHPGCWTHLGYQALCPDIVGAQIREFSKSACHPAIDIPPIFLFGIRVYFGHLSLVAQLGSKADWNEMVEKIMRPQFEKPPRMQNEDTRACAAIN